MLFMNGFHTLIEVPILQRKFTMFTRWYNRMYSRRISIKFQPAFLYQPLDIIIIRYDKKN